MEMKIKSQYSAYKDSGIEWLGEIPSHWKNVPLKDLALEEKYAFVDGPFGSDLKNEEYQNEGIPLIQLNNMIALQKPFLIPKSSKLKPNGRHLNAKNSF
jgi:hypothetical protein